MAHSLHTLHVIISLRLTILYEQILSLNLNKNGEDENYITCNLLIY